MMSTFPKVTFGFAKSSICQVDQEIKLNTGSLIFCLPGISNFLTKEQEVEPER